MIGKLHWYARIYRLMAGQYIKSRMSYRTDFIISSIGMLFSNIASLVVFWVLFNSIPDLSGWNFNEILFIYGFYLLSISNVQIFFDNLWQLRMHVVNGTFIKYYFRPLNMMFYYMAEMVDLKGFTQVAIGIFTLIYASAKLGLVWTLPRLILLVFSLVSASLVITALLILAASATFWVYGAWPILDLAFKLRTYSQYPITIFDGFFRFLFTYIIPIGFVAFYPSQLFLRPDEVSPLVYISPVIGISFFALAYHVWMWGVRSYSGTGS